MLGHIYIFSPCPTPLIPHPRSIFITWSYTVFSMYTLCKSRAFLLQIILFLIFKSFFSPPNRTFYFLIGWLLKKKIQMLNFFVVFWCFKMCCCFGFKTLYFLFTTTQHWKGHNFSLTGLFYVQSLLDMSVHCEFGDMSRCGSCYSVNCKLCSGFLKAFLSGSIIRHNVTASLVSVSFS